ncbi:helix-turn-helix domain-containing protein [Shewanella abyssi]|uniref:helix-turn-helix domain-containing protein n=1 Tax=Shewanella abyssi TaxID=311789 RepID=UPI003D161986
MALSRAENEPRKRIRLLAASPFLEGHSRTEVTNRLKVARGSVNTWVANYLAYGLKGLNTKKNKGRDSWITSRSKHPKQSPEAQMAFKKLPVGNDPSHTRPLTTRSS